MSTIDPKSDSPAPSADAERPPEAFPPFTERPPEAEVWRRARQDYLGGDTGRVVCERYGLSTRTFERRAADEGWRRVDVRPDACIDEPPPWAWRPRRSRRDIVAEHPQYHEIVAAHDAATVGMLFSPDPERLRTYAFRRACEAAVMDRPAEAASWLRVQRLCDQCAPLPDVEGDAFSKVDHLRAAFLKAIGDCPDEPEPEGG